MIQDAPVDLGLRFKGERTYLHGSDIYEAVSRAVWQQPDEKAWVSSLALRRTARTGCRLLYGEYEGDSDNIIATFRVLGSGQCSMGTVIETGRKVGGRYDYNEGQVVRGSEITDNMVAGNARTGFRPMEQIIALTKHLHQATVPVGEGRWIFTRLDLTAPFGSAVGRYSVRIMNNLANRMTISEVLEDGQKIGKITFTVADI